MPLVIQIYIERLLMENKNYSFDGFIGLFDNYFPEQYITDIIKWFNTIDKAGLVQSTKSYTLGHENDMDETQLIEYPHFHFQMMLLRESVKKLLTTLRTVR